MASSKVISSIIENGTSLKIAEDLIRERVITGVDGYIIDQYVREHMGRFSAESIV